MEKLKNIEMLRFLFSLSIVCVHFRARILKPFLGDIDFYNTLFNNFENASMPVDFFFIIAGFFLFLTTNFGQKFVEFAKKKLIRMLPVTVFIVLIYWVFSLFTPLNFIKYENIFTLIGLQNTGLTLHPANIGPAWFVWALFWSMSFYFYLYKCINQKIFNLITASIIFFCYALYIHTHGSMEMNVLYVFNRGMLRAFAGVGTGYFLSILYKEYFEKIKSFVANIWQKLFFTAVEIYLFLFLFYYLCFHPRNYDNPLIYTVAFIGLFILFVIQKGYFSKLLSNNLSVFLGQFSFSIFITHFFIRDLWGVLVSKNNPQWVLAHPYANLIILFLTIIIFGITTYYFVEKPAAKYLKKL